MSVALTSIVVLALAVGLLASVRSSAAADQVQRVDSALGSFSESLRTMPAPPNSPSGCPELGGSDGFRAHYDDYVSDGRGWAQSGVTTEIDDLEFWDPASGSYTAACPASGDPGAYRLGVSVQVEGDVASGQVVLSR